MAGSTPHTANRARGGPTDHEGFLKHRSYRWAKIAGVTVLVSVLAYFIADAEPRPNGGSWIGYTLGTIGAGLIVWLSLLGIRKRAITPGQWSLKAWTSAHVWLGLTLIVVATLHTGFQLGWNVHTLDYALMMLVIVSGLYGVYAYATMPAALSANRQEKTQGQMAEALAALDRQLDDAAQPLERSQADRVLAALSDDPFSPGILRRLSGHYSDCETQAALAAIQSVSGNDAAKEKVASLLRKRGSQLDQMRRHMRIKALLEVWLYIHVPATIALLAALLAHIISVFFYW